MSDTEAREQAARRTGPAQAGDPPPHREPRRWGRSVTAVAVVAVVAAAVVLVATNPFRHQGTANAGTSGAAYRTGTATVTQGSLTQQTQVDATLGDAGTYSVINQAGGTSGSSSTSSSSASSGSGGTITELPQPGQTIRQGHELYGVSGSPVVLLYGGIPAYRDLAEGEIGADVTELNTDLVRLGYVTAAELGPRSGWDYYSAVTADGVDALQAKLGESADETGSLTLGQVVFLPTAALITGYGPATVLGGTATPGAVVLTASSTTPLVTIPLDAADQSYVKAGDTVGITLPDGTTTPGVVSEVDTAATSSSSSSSSSTPGNSSSSDDSGGSTATVTVLVSLTHPKAAGRLNQAPVVVTITTGSVRDVLIVPVAALLAQAKGGYAVEVISGRGHHLVPVTPGLFDDANGKVQVTGTGLVAGQRIVVPAT